MADIAKIIEEVKAMTVLELNDLVKAIEEEFGVSAAAPVMVAGAAAAPAAEEKTEFDVVLAEVGANKMQAVSYTHLRRNRRCPRRAEGGAAPARRSARPGRSRTRRWAGCSNGRHPWRAALSSARAIKLSSRPG